MNISPVSNGANSFVSKPAQTKNADSAPFKVQNTGAPFIPANSQNSDPLLVQPGTAGISNAANNPVAATIQNTNVAFVPDNAETIVPVPAAVTTAGVSTVAASATTPSTEATSDVAVPNDTETIAPLPAAVDTAAASTAPASAVIPPTEGTSEVPVPDEIATTAPDTAQDVIPPLAAFNVIGGESKVVKPAPIEDLSEIGDNGEVEEALPPQPVLNNIPGNPAQAKISEKPYRGPSTGKRVQDYLRTIRTRAQATDREFQRRNLPYRFKVLTDNNENVLIDLSILDGQGKVIRHETRNVTNDNFGTLMDNISTGKGLLIDDLPQG
jgi:hypothetical protein